MKKNLISVVSFLLMLLNISCINEFTERVEGLLSAPQSGFAIVNAYDLGSKYEINLSVAKGGLQEQSCIVTYTMDPTILDSLNTVGGTSYQLLPTECYTLENTSYTVETGGERLTGSGKLIYDPVQISKLSGFNNVKYALPFRISAIGMPVNPSKSVVVYGFNIKEAKVDFEAKEEDVVLADNMKPLSFTAFIDFENLWDLKLTVASKNEAWVDNYNKSNKSYFTLLPAKAYTIGDATIAKGKNTGNGEVNLKIAEISPGNYLLPVALNALSGQGNANISINTDKVALFKISKNGNKIDSKGWTAEANTVEATGELAGGGLAEHLIDGNKETYWHSQWQPSKASPPYIVTIDMAKTNSVSQIGLLPRQKEEAITTMNMEVEASLDKEHWDPIGKYTLNRKKDDGSLVIPLKDEQLVAVKACDARYIRLIMNSTTSGVGHMAEVYVYGTDK